MSMIVVFMLRVLMMVHIFLSLYVVDMLIAVKSMVEVNKLKALLGKEFDMKDLSAARKIL